MAWDIYLFKYLNGLVESHSSFGALGIFSAVFLLPLMGFLLVLAAFTIKRFKEEHWYEMPLKACLAALIAYGVRFAVGELVGRPRPFVTFPDTTQLIPMSQLYDSFPSGHASLAFAIAFVVFKADRDWGISFLILAVLVAVGRVFVGVHYPVDVIAGAFLGFVAAELVHWFEGTQWRRLERVLRAR